ncbi:MAG: fluoride efflux transporter CrcB [Cytophagales bacterium]|nr:fluoride efflux transporter CrcB [Cytophagales bacterium]
MKEFIWVFLGSGLGGVCRFTLSRWFTGLHHYFPYGTLVVNLLACFILGLVVGLIDAKQLPGSTRFFLAAGFCGGFSTFSTFSHEMVTLYQSGHTTSVILYAAASVLFCLGATFGGLLLAQKIAG